MAALYFSEFVRTTYLNTWLEKLSDHGYFFADKVLLVCRFQICKSLTGLPTKIYQKWSANLKASKFLLETVYFYNENNQIDLVYVLCTENNTSNLVSRRAFLQMLVLAVCT